MLGGSITAFINLSSFLRGLNGGWGALVLHGVATIKNVCCWLFPIYMYLCVCCWENKTILFPLFIPAPKSLCSTASVHNHVNLMSSTVCWFKVRLFNFYFLSCEHMFVCQSCRKRSFEMPGFSLETDAHESTNSLIWWWERPYVYWVGMLSVQYFMKFCQMLVIAHKALTFMYNKKLYEQKCCRAPLGEKRDCWV